KLEKLEEECKTSSNVLIVGLVPKMTTVSAAEARSQALLRCAAVALACERYRQSNKGAWPETLDALVKAKLLDAVPRDPFDGQPLRYRRTKEGVVVYSIGADGTDNHGHIDRERNANEP